MFLPLGSGGAHRLLSAPRVPSPSPSRPLVAAHLKARRCFIITEGTRENLATVAFEQGQGLGRDEGFTKVQDVQLVPGLPEAIP